MPDTNPNTPTLDTATVPPVGRMTREQYDVERAQLEPTRAAAGVRWEQGLAGLFYRSGWTQEELARREDRSRTWIVYHLTFGRFLVAAGNVTMVTNLTERRFRTYWDRTAEHGHERLRFRAVLELMQAELTMGRSTIPKGHPKKIVAQFADGKWHGLPVIAKHLAVEQEEAERSLAGMVKDGRGGARTEVKRGVGGVKHYRFFKNARMVSSTELIEKLAPISQELIAETRKSSAQVSLMTFSRLASQLEKLLRELVE